MSSPTWEQRRRPVVRDALGVGVATGAYGVSFGAISVTSGLSILQTCVLSALLFSGGSQFALVGVVGTGGAPVSGAVTAVLLGSRNALYGLRLATLLDLRGLRKLVGAQLVIDESTAMAVAREERREAQLAFWATGLSVYVLWNAMTLLGALAGRGLGEPETYGLDAAVGAAFLALLWPRLQDATTRAVAGGAALLALVLLPLVPAGVPVMVAGLVAVAVGLPSRVGAPR